MSRSDENYKPIDSRSSKKCHAKEIWRETTPRNIIITLLKTKVLRETNKFYRGVKIQVTANFWSETLQKCVSRAAPLDSTKNVTCQPRVQNQRNYFTDRKVG